MTAFRDSTGKGIPLAVANKLADALITQLAPSCERIEVAGSIRRKKETVGDIELVCIPRFEEAALQQAGLFESEQKREPVNLLDRQLEQLLAAQDKPIFKGRLDLLTAMGKPTLPGTDVRRWGEKYKRFYLWGSDQLGVIAVDLFITVPEAWGAIFCIRTGPWGFSKALVTHLHYHTSYIQVGGCLVRKDTSAIVPVPQERDYFDAAGLPFIPPEERTAARLNQVVIAREIADSARKPSSPTTVPVPESPVTTVVNITGGNWQPGGVVYIGRPSKWGNPFVLGRDGTREGVIARYRTYLMESPELLADIPELVSKRLGCFCKPQACHGDVLAELANAYAHGEWKPPEQVQPVIRKTDAPYEVTVFEWLRGRLEAAAGIAA